MQNMTSEKPLIYLILGAAGSGRRAILANLIADGLTDGDRAATLLAASETANDNDARLGPLSRWEWTPDHRIAAAMPAGATHVFFVADGRRNPVDQVEAFRDWITSSGGELGAILCVVHCQLAERHHALLAWYDACVHFSDIVLLNRREGVANKWMSDFQGHFKAQYLPCLFEFVKNDRVKNAILMLEPQARRISQVFDETEIPSFTSGHTPKIEIEITDEDIDEDEIGEDDEDEEQIGEDPYFARRPGGRREKEIPDVAKFLDT